MAIASFALALALVQDAPIELLPHAELAAQLAALEAAHPDVVTRLPIGDSREGRRLEVLKLSTGGDGERPAILLVANLEGPRAFASGVALHHARRLASNPGEAGAALLAKADVYVLARANPDAAEARFATPRHERALGGRAVDDDRDGRQGEDAPGDVNGDGLVTTMRVVDPDGTWLEDPTEARAMIEADAARGQRGKWKLLTEGRDLDGDERVAEDPPGDTNVNRNFPAQWEEHAPDAGLFPTDEPEVRAIIEFVIAHPELALVVTYDGQDNLVEKPESVKDDARSVLRVPPPGVLESDATLIEEIGKRYRDATENEAKGVSPDAGSFQLWSYDHRGLLTLNAVLWQMPEEEAKKDDEDEDEDEGEGEDEDDEKKEDAPKPSQDAKRLAWIDGAEEAWRFVDWQPFDHPELGEVEIGGFAPYALIDPPEADRARIADAHYDFFVTLGDMLPRVEIVECTREELGQGVWRVEAAVENASLLPLQSRSARRTRTIRPGRVTLELPDAGKLLAGNRYALLSELEGSGGRVEYSWLVQGPAAMEIGVSVDTDNAGDARRSAEVVR